MAECCTARESERVELQEAERGLADIRVLLQVLAWLVKALSLNAVHAWLPHRFTVLEGRAIRKTWLPHGFAPGRCETEVGLPISRPAEMNNRHLHDHRRDAEEGEVIASSLTYTAVDSARNPSATTSQGQ